MATPILKLCIHCSIQKPLEQMTKASASKDGYRSMCRLCMSAYYAKRRIEQYERVRSYEKKFHRERRLKYQFGITPEQYDSMFAAQGGVCAICARATKQNLSIDHCHATGNVRALLCHNCNKGLGMLQDSPKLLETAAAYVRKYAKAKNLPNVAQGPLLWNKRERPGKSGVAGVRVEGDAFVAYVRVGGVDKRVGRFQTIEAATAARNEYIACPTP